MTTKRETLDQRIQRLMAVLCSLIDGEAAIEHLVACGDRAIPHLLSFLVDEPPRVIAQPRCWAVQALGQLGAYRALQNYLQNYQRSENSAVRLAEDAVRSAAARELARLKTEENFYILLAASKQRPSQGLVHALGEFERNESIPHLFHLLEDDSCSFEAFHALLRVPSGARSFAILLVRGQVRLPFEGPYAIRRRRATLKLLRQLGIEKNDARELAVYLADQDVDCVIEAAKIGLTFAEESEAGDILAKLIHTSPAMNGAQELETTEILDGHPALAREICRRIAAPHETRRAELPRPLWRILCHVLGNELVPTPSRHLR